MKKIDMRYTFSDGSVRIILNKSTILLLFYCKKQYSKNYKPIKYNMIKYNEFFTAEELSKIKDMVVISVKTGVEDLRDCVWTRTTNSTILETIEKIFCCHYIED